MTPISKQLPTLPLTEVAVDRTHGGALRDDIIDLSTSLNPLGPPSAALEAYRAAYRLISSYPRPYPLELEERLATWLGVDASNVLAGNGTTQLIYLIARVLRPKLPFVAVPTFSEIANGLRAAGTVPRGLTTSGDRNFELTFEAVHHALHLGADAIFIGRPNCPTGTTISIIGASEIARVAAERNAWLVFDEAFLDFVHDPSSAIALIADNPKVMVLRSLTKIFAIPGLRLGCLVADRPVVERLREVMEPWSVNVVAASVGMACLDNAEEFIQQTRRLVTAERAYLNGELALMDSFRWFPSVANFLMFEALREREPGELGDFMLRRGIAIRDLQALPGCGRGFYRTAIGTHAQNQRLVSELRTYAEVLASEP